MSHKREREAELADPLDWDLDSPHDTHAIFSAASKVSTVLLKNESEFESEDDYEKTHEALEVDIAILIEWMIEHPEFNCEESILGAFIGIAAGFDNHSDVSYDWRLQARLLSMFIYEQLDNELMEDIEDMISRANENHSDDEPNGKSGKAENIEHRTLKN